MEDLKKRLDDLKQRLDLEGKRGKIRRLEAEAAEPGFWQDRKRAESKMRELSLLQKEVEEIERLETVKDAKELERGLERLEIKTFLSGPHDRASAILSIHAGAGGTEAMDWTEMLSRMYERFGADRKWKVILLDQTFGEEAGLKSISFQIDGDYAYGYLKGEAGVHRLVRQSPFNADQLRQTSFALVEITPLIEEDTEVEIKPEDLKVETFRSSGPGGQHMQKTESAVRITHLPTKITAVCQSDRLQQRNKERALKILRSKLYEMERAKSKEQKAKMKGKYKTPGWGNQIRSYVLHPYKLVKDLRTGVESTAPEKVLDGELDEFIEAELRQPQR